MAKIPIGKILVDEGFINASQLNDTLKKKHLYPRVMTGDLLVLMGYLTTDQLHAALEIQRKGKPDVSSNEKPLIDNTSVHSLAKTQSALIKLLIKKEIFTKDELIDILNQS